MSECIDKEQWKPIVGYEGLYEVSNLGRIKSIGFGTIKIRRQNIVCGYAQVLLCKNGEKKQKLVHRLVYEAFVGNIPKFIQAGRGNGDKMFEINHIDENKLNNNVENLELVTCTQNNNHGKHKERIAQSLSRKVYQYTMLGELVKVWNSIKSCNDWGFNPGAVGACCRNEYCRRARNDYKGHIWSYYPINTIANG